LHGRCHARQGPGGVGHLSPERRRLPYAAPMISGAVEAGNCCACAAEPPWVRPVRKPAGERRRPKDGSSLECGGERLAGRDSWTVA
jgi:hypothetical protein